MAQGSSPSASATHRGGRLPQDEPRRAIPRRPRLLCNRQLPLQHIVADILPRTRLQRPRDMLLRHAPARGGRAPGRSRGHQGERHTKRAATGMVRRGIPVHRIGEGVQPAPQGEVGCSEARTQRRDRPRLRRGPFQDRGQDHLRAAPQNPPQLREIAAAARRVASRRGRYGRTTPRAAVGRAV